MNLLQHIAVHMQDVKWPEGAKYVALSAEGYETGVLDFFPEMPTVKYNCSRAGKYHWVGENKISHYERIPYHWDAKLRAFTQEEIAMAQYPLPGPKFEDKPKDSNEMFITFALLGLIGSMLLNIFFLMGGHIGG